VREAVSVEAAERIAGMKKQDMAEAAEQLLVGTGWLPALMLIPQAVQSRAGQPQTDVVTEAHADAFSVAAE
jgi:ParB family transcriptional regulator, chromosome partitioning protein